MAYAKRYLGGFVDLPSQTTAIDSTFLNAVEAALLKLFDTDPTVDGQVQSWISASTKFGPALLLNKNIDAAAAIAASKLDFSGANGIIDANIKSNAAIAITKLANISDATQFLRGDGTWGKPTYGAYTPTWTTSGTAPALGNAATSARFAQVGKIVHAYGVIQFGTTTTFGTGVWSFALPVPQISGTAQQIGTLDMRHNASGARQIAWATVASGLLVPVTQATWGGVEQDITNLIPWTWANTDWIAWNLVYEAA